MVAFRDASLVDAMAMVTCGFELETQETEGCTWDGLEQDDGDFNEDSWQQALTDYLIEHTAELPDDVRERWEKVRSNRFFQPGVQRDKYSFVHAHEQGTWEFRCFGNVKNAADGQRCLELAVLAMQHAYKVLTGQERLVSDRLMLSNQDWRTLAERAMQRGDTMTEAAREFSVEEVA